MRKHKSVCICLFLLIFGCGKSAVDEHLEKGRVYLEKGLFRPAQVEYYTVINPNGLDPRSCEGHYGYLLSLGSEFTQFGIWVDMILMDIVEIGDFIPASASLSFRSLFPSQNLSIITFPNSLIYQLTNSPTYQLTFSSPAIFPNQFSVPAAALDSVVESYIYPTIDQFLLPLENSVKFVIENNCRFETPGIPIYLNLDLSPPATAWIGKKFGPAEANLFGAFTAWQLAYMYYLSSLDLHLEVTPFMHLSTEDPLSDLVGTLRQLGLAMTSSDTFLGFHATRRENYNQVSPYLSLALERMAKALRLTFRESGISTPAEAREHFLGYYDADQNGSLDSGDDLYLGILKFDPPLSLDSNQFVNIADYPINLLEKSLIWTFISGDLPEKIEGLLLEIRDKLTGADPGLFNLAELNGLLPAGFQALPDTFALDFHALLPPDVSQAKSIREFLPGWGTYDPPGGQGTELGDPHPIFLDEGELGSASTPADYLQEVAGNDPAIFAYTRGPGPHFSAQVYGTAGGYFSLAPEVKARLLQSTGADEVVPIPDDCAQLSETSAEFNGIKIPLTYFYWQDPSFNGSLYVNLQSLRMSGGACDALDAASSSAGWDSASNNWPKENNLRANQYSVNKALNAFLKTILPLVGSLPL
ncbi:MAG: hypothetical protein NT009_13995 [Proteobacteria bacterium]|nr:hypothetical protein [Pseudomonadota bacterium]